MIFYYVCNISSIVLGASGFMVKSNIPIVGPWVRFLAVILTI